MTSRDDLARACRAAGSRVPEWTQANGGNVSVKDADTLWIKASGARLDAVTSERNIAGVRRSPWAKLAVDPRAVDGDRYADELKAATVTAGARPSMETALHALLPGRWVVHLHSLAAMVMARTGGGCFPTVPFALPGWDLARAVAEYRDRDVILLANHGVVLQDDAAPDLPGGALERWREHEEKFARRGPPILRDLLAAADSTVKARLLESLPPGRRRVYFPDAAVFSDAVVASLVDSPPGSGRFRLRPGASATHRDAAELWWATRILEEACPDMPELPAGAVAALGGMRLERERRKAAGR